MDNVIWTDHKRNEEVLRSVKEQMNTVKRINRRMSNWILHILCRNCLIIHVIEGRIEERMEVTGRRGRRIKQLLDGLRKGEDM
jgi:hypothetical protein